MKILERSGLAPVHLVPGDTLRVTYRDPEGETHELVEYTCVESEVIDTALICRLDEAELEQLGLGSGLAGIVGRSV